jgi:hypothetical protein
MDTKCSVAGAMEGLKTMIRFFMISALDDASITDQGEKKVKSIFLETTYFSGMVCPVGVLAPAKTPNSWF